jgi:hypothetical protein
MTNKDRDKVYTVVWNGGEGLVPDRETKHVGSWETPKRAYNKTGKFVGQWKPKSQTEPKIDYLGDGD